ncbi:MAG TPA: flagellar hook-associated protein FlgL [Longimicrobiales bacterium]
MRITNNGLQREALANCQRGLAEIDEIRERVASGTRIRQPSDDPIAAGAVLRTDGRLRALEQYRRNIDAARVRASAEENVLEQLTGLLTRARELAVGQADATATAETRAAARREVDELLATVVQLGNTRFQGSYLFGGAFADAEPFDATGATDPAHPPVGDYRVEVAAGQLVRAHHDGQTVFVDSGIISALQDLSAALDADDDAGVKAAISAVDDAFGAVQTLTGEIGPRWMWLRPTSRRGTSICVRSARTSPTSKSRKRSPAWSKDYVVDLGDADVAGLGAATPADILVLSIVTLPATAGDPCTVNLQGPLVMHLARGQGRQVVLNEPEYGVRCPLDLPASTPAT